MKERRGILDVTVLHSPHLAQAHGIHLALAALKARWVLRRIAVAKRGDWYWQLSSGMCDQLDSCTLYGVCLYKCCIICIFMISIQVEFLQEMQDMTSPCRNHLAPFGDTHLLHRSCRCKAPLCCKGEKGV